MPSSLSGILAGSANPTLRTAARPMGARPGSLAAAGRAPVRTVRLFNPNSKAAKKKKEKKQGWLGQLKDLAGGLVPGLLTFAGQVGQTAVAPLRAGLDVATGHLAPSKYLQAATAPVWGAGLGLGDSPWDEDTDEWSDIARTYAPATHSIAESVRRTGERFAATAAEPFGHEWGAESYGEAYQKGGLVGALAEDIGNVSLVAGGVGSVAGKLGTRAGAAALEGAAAGTPGAEAVAAAAAKAARGRGLAGMLERRGATEAAGKAARIGEIARQVEMAGDPFRVGAKLGGKALEKVGLPTPVQALSRAAEAGKFPRILGQFTQQAKDLRAIQEIVDRKLVEGQSAAAKAGAMATKGRYKLTDEQMRLVPGIVSQEFEGLRRMRERLDDEVFERIVDHEDAFPGVSQEARPTGREVIQMLDAGIDAMDSDSPALRKVVGALTETALRRTTERSAGIGYREPGRVLNPEYTADPTTMPGYVMAEGATPGGIDAAMTTPGRRIEGGGVVPEGVTGVLSEEVTSQRIPIQRKLGVAQRVWERQSHSAAKETRILNAMKAALTEVPAPLSYSDVFARGKQAGRRATLASRIRSDLLRAQRKLADAVSDMMEGRVHGADALAKAEAEIDRLTAEVNRRMEVLAGRERRVQAAQGFATATGDIEAGPRAVVERDAAGVPVLRRKLRAGAEVIDPEAGTPSITRAAPPPAPEALALPAEGRLRAKEVRERLKAVRGDLKLRGIQYLDELTGGARMKLVRKERRRKGSGEYDWSEQMDPGLRAQMLRDGLLVSEKNLPGRGAIRGEGFGPDQIAAQMEEQLGRVLSVDEAVQLYLEAAANVYDPRNAHLAVAEQLGLSAEDVAAIAQRGEKALDAMDEAMKIEVEAIARRADQLDPEARAELVGVTGMLDKVPDISDLDYADILGELSGQADTLMERGGLIERLSVRGVPIRDVVHAILAIDAEAFFTTVRGKASPAQQRQLGRFQGDVTAAAAGVRQAESALRAGQRAAEGVAAADSRAELAAAQQAQRLSDVVGKKQVEAETATRQAEMTEALGRPAEPMMVTPPSPKEWADAAGNPALLRQLERRHKEAARFAELSNDPRLLRQVPGVPGQVVPWDVVQGISERLRDALPRAVTPAQRATLAGRLHRPHGFVGWLNELAPAERAAVEAQMAELMAPYIAELPDTIKLYRGVSAGDAPGQAWESWTTDPNVAQRHFTEQGGRVLERSVPRSEIGAVIPSNLGEVLVRPEANVPRLLQATPVEAEAFTRRMHAQRPGQLSQAQRMAQRLGEQTERTRQAVRKEKSAKRRLDRLFEENANVPTELARGFQERLLTDINDPFNRTVGSVETHRNPLTGQDVSSFVPGTVVRRMLSSMKDPARREYLMERLLETRQAIDAEGVRLNGPRELIDTLNEFRHDLDAEGQNALKATIEKYEGRYNKHMKQGINGALDPQLSGAPDRYRGGLQNVRRAINAALKIADEEQKLGNVELANAIRMAVEDTPSTVAQLHKQGSDPVHLIGGQPSLNVVSGRARVGGGTVLGRKGTAEFHSESGLTTRHVVDYSGIEAKDAATRAFNEGRKMIDEQFASRADQLEVDGQRIAFDAEGRPLPARDLARAAQEAGYAPISGDVVLPDTSLVPVAVRKAIDAFEKNDRPAVLEALGRANAGWKRIVLFSPRWHMGNIVGNALQAMVYGAQNPIEFGRSLAEVIQRARKSEGGLRGLYEEGGLLAGLPAELKTSGLTLHERQGIGQGQERPAKTRAGQWWKDISDRSFAANEFIDGITRSATYLSKRKKGLSSADAVTQSLRALGNYNKMRPNERRYVREIIPFYTWLRHQTQAMARLPIDHPGRTAWYMHLGDMFANDEDAQEMFRLLGASAKVGEYQLPLSSLSPFPDIGGAGPMPMAVPFLDPGVMARSLSPFIKLPIAAATGLNVDRMQGFNRPEAMQRVGAWGQEENVPLWQSPKELAYLAAGITPQSRSLRDILMGPDVQRYSTGIPVTDSRGRPKQKREEEAPYLGYQAGELAAMIGVPWARSREELEAVTARRKKKEREMARARR